MNSIEDFINSNDLDSVDISALRSNRKIINQYYNWKLLQDSYVSSKITYYEYITKPYIGKYFKFKKPNYTEYIYISNYTDNWLIGICFTDLGELNLNLLYSWEILKDKEISKDEFINYYLQFTENLIDKMNLI